MWPPRFIPRGFAIGTGGSFSEVIRKIMDNLESTWKYHIIKAGLREKRSELIAHSRKGKHAVLPMTKIYDVIAGITIDEPLSV
jgi:hypothetical protein